MDQEALDQDQDPVLEEELVRLVVLEDYKVPGRALNTLFDLAEPDTEDTVGCLDSGTHFGMGDDNPDSDDCSDDWDDLDGQDNPLVAHTLQGAAAAAAVVVAAAAVAVGVVVKTVAEVDEADSRDVHLYRYHNVVDRRMDCWRRYFLLHAVEDSRDSVHWGIHPSMVSGALLPKTGTNLDCLMILPARAH